MPTPSDNDVLRMDGWPKGVNNRLRETESQAATRNQFEIPSSPWLRDAKNVDITADGHPKRRLGYSLVSGGFSHSLWSDPRLDHGLFVREGSLCALEADGSHTPLTEVSPFRPVAYQYLNGAVYWSNGEVLGQVIGRQVYPWGVPVASEPAVSVAASGGLFTGRYSVVVTYIDAQGTEHGASEAVVVDVQEGEGVHLEFSTPTPAASAYGVYCTQANSEVLYLVQEVAATNSQYTITQNMLGKGRVAETQHRQPPRAGQLISYFNGRLYIARRDTVFFTDPLRYHLTQPSKGIFMFDGDVALLAPVADGQYVGGSFGVVFLQGTDPYDVTQRAVRSAPPVPRAFTTVPGSQIGVGQHEVPLWWGQDGVLCAGLDGGTVRPLTEDRLAVPSHKLGAMLHREREGMHHVVSILRQSEDVVVGAVDTVVAEIRRGCVKLNG